jgi:hypothetical protein
MFSIMGSAGCLLISGLFVYMWNAGYWLLDVGYWISDAELYVPDTKS